MYEKIKAMRPVFEKYCQKLVDQGIITEAEIKEAKAQMLHKYEESYKNAVNNTIKEKW
jgi:2-oxoglutarate dehydrogenase complex dehydrogenase (E1) component-like enzyme